MSRKIFRAILAIGLWSGVLAAAEASKSPPPAKVTNPVKEADLARLTLTSEAERRLGIVTAKAEVRKLERARFYGGEAILPAWSQGSGTNGSSQTAFAILPAFTPAELVRVAQSQIEADGQVDLARVQLETAKTGLARAEQLLRDKAGSPRLVEESRAQAGLGEAGLRTALARRALLGPTVLTATNPPTLWVRTAVYAGDLATLNTEAPAGIGGLGNFTGAGAKPAKPVSAPPSANAAAVTVDLFYELDNQDGSIRPGQRVGVTIPVRGEEEYLVVPWSAVIHDAQGDAWIYELTGPGNYLRRRVQVKRVAGQQAGIAGAVKPGAQVVSTGVAELFGVEFGAGK